ncbi:MAG: dockerin type I repeat-containing protein, partial [Clostridiales bacterium]|nr:dockerin type I repeat-containing protein [Clostridiales bacterium]
MSFNKTSKRVISILLSLVMLLGSFPISALALPDIDFEDEEKYGFVPEFLQTGSAQLASVGKYLKLYEKDTNLKLAEGEYGSQPELFAPIIPDGREWILEFTQEQTQFIRLELWSEEGWDEDRENYLGLIAASDAEGQWGIYDGDQWYDRDKTQKPIANYVEWNGLYWDHEQQEMVLPGQTYGEPLEMGTYAFYIVFQPTHTSNQGYRNAIRIEIDYTEEAILKNMPLRDSDDPVTDELTFCANDPVYMLNGNFIWDYTDFAVYGAQPLEFTRYYNALDKKESELGYGWRHNFMYSIDKSGLTATAFFPDGNRIDYNIKGDGSFVGPAGKDYELEADGNGYLMTDKALTKYFFDEDGYLTAIEDVNGRRTEIERNGAEIDRISNSSGTLNFDYAENAPADLIGDVDEDGVLSIDDVIMVMQYAAGVISLTTRQFYLGDVNGDGVVDLADAALILRLISEGNPSPSIPDEMPMETDEMPFGIDEMPLDTDNMPMDTDSISMDSEGEQQIIDCISGFAARKGLTTADIRSNTSNLEDALQMLVSTVNEERYDRITTINS